MPQQERAERTRSSIIYAAAEVFGEYGYDSAAISDILKTAEVTKGALYFHFPSKRHLAQAVLDAQVTAVPVPPEQPLALQGIVDQTLLLAHLLAHDPLVRGSVRLTIERPRRGGPDRRIPYLRWSDNLCERLGQAAAQGELLPHTSITRTAELLVGAFAGIQGMSQTLSGYADLAERASFLLRTVLSTVSAPVLLDRLDITPDRGSRLLTEIQATRPAGDPAGEGATPAKAAQ